MTGVRRARAGVPAWLLVLLALVGPVACGDAPDERGDADAPPPAARPAPDSGAGADSAGIPAPGARAAEVRAPRDACRDASSERTCADEVQALNLGQAPGRVLITDSTLALRTGAGWIRFRENDVAGDSYVRHLFAGQFPDRTIAVVERRLYVGADYVLVDWRSGDTTVVTGVPLPSPNGRYVAVAERDYGGTGGEDILEVWARGDDGFRKRWSCQAGYGYGPDDLRWGADGTLSFVWMDRNDNYVMATAQRDATGEWSVDTPPPGISTGECGPA